MSTMSTPHLRPLTVGQILDRAVRLYRNHFRTFLAIVAIVQVPLGIVQLFNAIATWFINNNDSSTLLTGVAAIASLLSLGVILIGVVANQIAATALARSVADVYLGRTTNFAAAYRAVRPVLGNLIITLLILAVVGIALAIFALIPLIGWFPGAGMLIFFSWIVAPMMGPILILEKRAGFDLLRRAWDLARRRFWQVMGYGVVLMLFVLGITLGPSLLLSYLVNFVWGGFEPATTPFDVPTMNVPIWGTLLQTVTTVTLQTVLLPVQLAAASVLYFDLRVRTEGLDLELLLTQQADEPVDLDLILQNAPRPRQDQLVVGDEWLNFGAIGCVLWILGGILFAAFIALAVALVPFVGGF